MSRSGMASVYALISSRGALASATTPHAKLTTGWGCRTVEATDKGGVDGQLPHRLLVAAQGAYHPRPTQPPVRSLRPGEYGKWGRHGSARDPLVAQALARRLAHEPVQPLGVAQLPCGVPEIELVQVPLQVLPAHVVVGAIERPLELAEVVLGLVDGTVEGVHVDALGVVGGTVGGKRRPIFSKCGARKPPWVPEVLWAGEGRAWIADLLN